MAQSYQGGSGLASAFYARSSGTATTRWLQNVHLFEYADFGSCRSGEYAFTVIEAGSRDATGSPFFMPHMSASGEPVAIDAAELVGSGSYPQGMSYVRSFVLHGPGKDRGLERTTFTVVSAGTRIPNSFNPFSSVARAGVTFSDFTPFESRNSAPPRWMVQVHNYRTYGPGANRAIAAPSIVVQSGTRTPGPSVIPPSRSWSGGALDVSENLRNKLMVFSDDESQESMASFDVQDMSVVPTPPAGMSVWLKSDAGVTKDGSNNVSAWADQSPFGNNATASGSYRPVWTVSKFNGLPGIKFNGGQIMTIPYSATYDSTELTAYVVLLPGVLTSANGYILSRDNGTTRFWEFRQRGDSSSWALNNEVLGTNNGGDVGIAAVRMPTLGSRIYSVGFDYSSQSLNLYRRSWLNGKAMTTTAISGALGLGTALGMYLGANGANSYYWTGYLAEVFVWPRTLTPAERTQLHWYLYTRYEIAYDPDNVVKQFKIYNNSESASQLSSIVGIDRTGITTNLTPPVTQRPLSEQTVTVTVQRTNQGPFSTLADFRYTVPAPSRHGYIYLTGIRPIGTPSDQPTNLVFSRITGTTMRLTWDNATSAPSGYIVLRSASPVVDVPADNTLYLAGNAIGAAYVAYCGPDVTFLDTGLSPTTVYHYSIFSWNGSVISGLFSYNTVNPLSGSHETLILTYVSGPDIVDYSNDQFCGVPFQFTPCTGSDPDICVVYPIGISAPSYILYGGVCYSLVGVPPTTTGLRMVERIDTVPELACSSVACTQYEADGPCYPYTFNGERVVVRFPRPDLGRPLFGAVQELSDTGYAGLDAGQYAKPATSTDNIVVISPGTGQLEFVVGLQDFRRKIYRNRAGAIQTWDLYPGTTVARIDLLPQDVVGIDLSNEARKLDKNVRGKMLVVTWIPVHALPRVYDTAVVAYSGSTSIKALGFAGLNSRLPYVTYATLPFVGVADQVNPDSIVTVVDSSGSEYVLLAVRALGDTEQQLPPQVPLYAGQSLTGPLTFKFWAGRSMSGRHGEMDVWFDSDQSYPSTLLLDQFRQMAIDPSGYPMAEGATDIDRNCLRVQGQYSILGLYRASDGERLVAYTDSGNQFPSEVAVSTGKAFDYVRAATIGSSFLKFRIEDLMLSASPTGIPSEETLSVPTLYKVNWVAPTGIPSEETFGNPSVVNAGPQITSISPNNGVTAGGTSVTIYGLYFS